MPTSATQSYTAVSTAKGLIFAALICPLGIASVPALANGIQMLPPVTELTKTYPDTNHPTSVPTTCPQGSANILTWDGQYPISCTYGVTVTGGNVGIGTSTPQWPLQVYNHFAFEELSVPGPTSGDEAALNFETYSAGGDLMQPNTLGWQLAVAGNNNGVPGIQANDMMFHYWNGSGWLSPNLTLTPAGNAGIGTPTPQGTLDVENGSNTATIVQNGKQLYPFGGMFQEWLCDTSNVFHADASGGGCRIPNQTTGTCTCPAGYSAIQIDDFNSPNNQCPQAYYEFRGMIQYYCQ